MRARCISCIAAVLFWLPGAAPAADEVRVISLPVLASELIGKPVADAAGAALGKVADVVLELPGNRARYIIVSLDGRRIGVPVAALDPSLERDRVILDVTRERLLGAPAFAEADDYWARVEGYWSAPAASTLARASRLIESGSVWDVLIDAHAGEVPFAIVSTGGDALHPVPLDALSVEAGKVVLEVEPERRFSARELEAGLQSDEFLRRNAAYADGLTPDTRRSRASSARR